MVSYSGERRLAALRGIRDPGWTVCAVKLRHSPAAGPINNQRTERGDDDLEHAFRQIQLDRRAELDDASLGIINGVANLSPVKSMTKNGKP